MACRNVPKLPRKQDGPSAQPFTAPLERLPPRPPAAAVRDTQSLVRLCSFPKQRSLGGRRALARRRPSPQARLCPSCARAATEGWRAEPRHTDVSLPSFVHRTPRLRRVTQRQARLFHGGVFA